MPNYVADLLEFIRAVGERWPDLAIGGIIGFLWIGYEKLRNKSIPLKTFFVILGVSLFFATFGAWRERSEKAKPVSLRAFVEPGASSVIFGEMEDGSASLVLLLTVVNAGRPTTLHGFLLDVMEGKNKVYEVGPEYLSQNTTFEMLGGGTRRIKQSEMIYNKVLSPIVEGGQVSGFVHYILKGFSRDELFKNDRVFVVSFWDAAGKEYNVKVRNLHRQFPQGIIPGVDNPFLPFNPDATPPSPTPGTEASPN